MVHLVRNALRPVARRDAGAVAKELRFPRGLGHDFAGTIESIGEGVARFKAGDDVL